jgi:hypothetical protein
MQINNLFQMNDWEIKKFLKVILTIQLAMWGVIGLDAIGLQIPIIRQRFTNTNHKTTHRFHLPYFCTWYSYS